MKTPLSLSSRIWVLASINVLLLLIVLLAIARFQYRLEVGSILSAPARDRVVSVAHEVAVDLEQTAPEARTALMGRYAASYGVDFYLFRNDGTQLAGRPVALPAAVAAELRRPVPRQDPPPVRRDRPPPRRDTAGEGPLDREPPPPPPPGQREDPPPAPGRAGLFQLSANDLHWAGVRIPVPDRDGGLPIRATLVMAARSFYGTPLFFDFKPWLAALGAVIAIFLICWLPFIRGLSATIRRITRATEQIAEGQFEHQLADGRGDELGQLSVAINRMASRLSGFVSGQKRFLGDIAHELCAPIARMQFALGILDQRAEENQRAALEDVHEEMRQMSSLVNELLSFSRAGMDAKKRTLVPVDASAVLREALAREASGANGFQLDFDTPLMVMADRDYLLRSLSNLVRNAVRYAGFAGPIAIAGRREGSWVVITVADSGPGIPQEEIDRIFTPFYRLETSRNRAMGGVGLGLAIVKSCIEACHGTVTCGNRYPQGFEVQIRLTAA